MHTPNYTVSQNRQTLYSCPYLHQISTALKIISLAHCLENLQYNDHYRGRHTSILDSVMYWRHCNNIGHFEELVNLCQKRPSNDLGNQQTLKTPNFVHYHPRYFWCFHTWEASSTSDFWVCVSSASTVLVMHASCQIIQHNGVINEINDLQISQNEQLSAALLNRWRQFHTLHL